MVILDTIYAELTFAICQLYGEAFQFTSAEFEPSDSK